MESCAFFLLGIGSLVFSSFINSLTEAFYGKNPMDGLNV
jgi:hypothetical protein